MSQTAFDAFLFYRSYRESLNGMTQKDQLATLLATMVTPSKTGEMTVLYSGPHLSYNGREPD